MGFMVIFMSICNEFIGGESVVMSYVKKGVIGDLLIFLSSKFKQSTDQEMN